MSSILAAGLVMLSGVALGRVAAGFGVSSVVGYLLAGITLGHAWPGTGGAITQAGAAFAEGARRAGRAGLLPAVECHVRGTHPAQGMVPVRLDLGPVRRDERPHQRD